MKMQSITVLVLMVSIPLLGFIGCSSIERMFLFYPTHRPHDNDLTPWMRGGEVIGYARKVASPKQVWLMLHGNGGQASDRIYAIPNFSTEDSVFILEYPGYGSRQGVPSKDTFDRSAREAYLLLRETYPRIPVCVVGESIGSGPAASLAGLSPEPDKFVLIVPFDVLSSVAEDHFPAFLVRLVLKSNWDNIAALSKFKGPVEIIGAAADTIIPVRHARALAAAIPGSKLLIIEGGHNDWPFENRVKIRYQGRSA